MKVEKTSYGILVLEYKETKKSRHADFSFILVLHVKIIVIKSVRKANYDGEHALLKFPTLGHFAPI